MDVRSCKAAKGWIPEAKSVQGPSGGAVQQLQSWRESRSYCPLVWESSDFTSRIGLRKGTLTTVVSLHVGRIHLAEAFLSRLSIWS